MLKISENLKHISSKTFWKCLSIYTINFSIPNNTNYPYQKFQFYRVASNCHQTLTIACSESPSGLNLSPLLLTRKPAEQDQMFGDSTKSGQGLVALQTGQTLTYTPFCKSKQQRAPAVDAATDSIGYEDQKANGLCKSLDFSCGMESRNHKLNISSTFDNLG